MEDKEFSLVAALTIYNSISPEWKNLSPLPFILSGSKCWVKKNMMQHQQDPQEISLSTKPQFCYLDKSNLDHSDKPCLLDQITALANTNYPVSLAPLEILICATFTNQVISMNLLQYLQFLASIEGHFSSEHKKSK